MMEGLTPAEHPGPTAREHVIPHASGSGMIPSSTRAFVGRDMRSESKSK